MWGKQKAFGTYEYKRCQYIVYMTNYFLSDIAWWCNNLSFKKKPSVKN